MSVVDSSDPADVIDAQDARLEIYIRMNEDEEKDYCFSVGINDTFESLIEIFKVLKLSLRPSVFYEQIPIGFKVSLDPGYLTDNGGLLFTTKATKIIKQVSLTDVISEHAWPGQLIVPVWKEDHFVSYSLILALLAWLYTDLPDFISPTPGISLTNQVSKALAHVLFYFELNDAIATDILAETVPHQTGFYAQIIFFVIHILKVIFVYLAFWSGLFNPYSLNPLETLKSKKADKLDETKRQQLLKVGWTGSRKATLEEYRDFVRDVEVKKYGTLVKASKAGLFDRLRNPVVTLKAGEGFDSSLKLDGKLTLKDLEEDPNHLFKLNYEVFAEIGQHFENYLSTESSDVNQDIKNFRKYGPSETSDRLKKIIQERKLLDILEGKKKK